jgi:hypothetical protein
MRTLPQNKMVEAWNIPIRTFQSKDITEAEIREQPWKSQSQHRCMAWLQNREK